MNAVALLLLGWRLEGLIGRAWFGAIYVTGALGGSLLSLALNPPSVIAVGASGAIMALLAAALIASVHFPSGAVRNRMWLGSMLALIVALLPLLAASLRDQPVDYAAHLGGALAGLLVGLVILKVWPKRETQPGLRRVAMGVAVAGAIALAYPAIAIPRVYRAMAFITQLIPSDQVPRSSAR